jgi:hypothetical protein
MMLCLLVYRLVVFRMRSRLTQTQQTTPDQVHKPTSRPTMRWIFQRFEGIELLHVHTSISSLVHVLRLQPVHQLILQLLGPQSLRPAHMTPRAPQDICQGDAGCHNPRSSSGGASTS